MHGLGTEDRRQFAESSKKVNWMRGNGDGSGSSRSGPLSPGPRKDSPRIIRQTRNQENKFNKVLYYGTVLFVNYEKGFGMLTPNMPSTNHDAGTRKNDVHFKVALGADQLTSTMTGGITLIKGDTLEYVLPDIPKGRSSTLRATLCKCKARKMDEVVEYVKSLVANAEEHPDIVLRNVTRCPAALRYVLDYDNPSEELLKHTLDLFHILQSNKLLAEVYRSRLKQMYTLFSESLFLVSETGVQKYAMIHGGDESLRNTLKEILINLLESIPSQLPQILPLLMRLGACEKPRTSNSIISTNLEAGEQPCEGGSFLMKILNVVAGGRSQRPGSRPWAQLPLLPTMKELKFSSNGRDSTLPVVRKIGSYGSPDDYIDTYFRLLRADCFAGLLQGMQAFCEGKLDDRDMKMWEGVTFVGVHFNHTSSPGLTFAVRLPQKKSKKDSKAPDNGSLVCISDDGRNFDMPIWGVVRRCEEDAEKVCICFVDIVVQSGGIEQLSSANALFMQCTRLMNGGDMVMVESPTAYYAYQHVLEALQLTDPQTIPFQEELVSVTWPNKAPEYLKSPSTNLDWSCIFDPPEPPGWFTRCLSFVAEGIDLGRNCLSASGEIREGIGGVASLQKQRYKTSFDASQLKAVELAVNNRLTIIQGPPGTGKTYIACKLLQLLLSANTFPKESPVLVITFKNHALDQFLEKCLTFCNGEDSIVRVGGRSQNENLEKYNLKNKENRKDDFQFEQGENYRRTKEIQQNMESALEEVNKRLMNFDPLMIVTPEQQLHYFTSRLTPPDRVQTICARSLPEGFSLAELLVQDQYPEDADPEWVTDLLWFKQALVAEIKRWIPRPDVLQSVQECFSMKKPSSITNLQGYVSGAKMATDDKAKSTVVDGSDEEDDREEQERRSAYESMRQDTKLEELDAKSTHFDSKNKTYQWLQNDFMAFSKEKDVHKASVAFSHLDNLDASQFDWLAQGNPYDLSPERRAILVFKCWNRSVDEAWQRFASIKAQYDTILQDREEISKRRTLAILRKHKIIGMTTSGAAMHQSVLKCLSPAVILVEEAAEILEPNVLAVLHSNLQHLILIGDHKQLRPKVESYSLDRWHGFTVSMFERLVEHNKLPFQHLSQQCRMRDEFVPMLLPIYPFLKSHTALVSGNRNKAPMCMEKTMYFWSHTFQETSQRSYANPAEAGMVVALARWVASELENPKGVTILAPYSGQVTIIQKMLENYPELKEIKVHTIDRFQGAESEIVIVSLVRSNQTGKIGYLSDRSRLCVAASRARAGVYLVGNHTTLTQKSVDWRTLVRYFESQQAISCSIPLRCPRHPNRPPFALASIAASKFETSDVCNRGCEEGLPCGHSCVRPCHMGGHSLPCKEQVRFVFRLCGHSHNKMCHEDEEKLNCKTKVMHKFDNCDHTTQLDCWKVKGMRKLPDLACSKDCEKKLKCGHICRLRCSEYCAGTPCQSCREIEMQTEKIKQQVQTKLKEEKLKELEVEIHALEAKGNAGIVVHEVFPGGNSSEDFYLAKERVEKTFQPDCKSVPVVTKVEKVENQQLQTKFLEAQKELVSPQEIPKWLFCGGPDDLLNQVVIEGFRIIRRKQEHYCFDVYSSTTAQESHGKLLLCQVQLGRTWRKPSASKMNLGKLRENGYDSVSLIVDRESDLGEAYRHVIYNPEQAIPRFIVSYKLMNFRALAKADGFENFGERIARENSLGMCRLPLEPALNFQGDNPEDYHFRMAESQFFRMSKNRKHKVTKVEVIVNLALKDKYLQKQEEFRKNKVANEERFVFHGTDSGAIDKIATSGFKIGGTEGVAIKCGAVYGHGVYTAVNPDISVAYSRGSKMMLLSRAIPGILKVHYSYGQNNEVLLINDVSQLLPRYVVHYS